EILHELHHLILKVVLLLLKFFLEILLISLEIVELELKVIHISVVCCGVGFEFALRNRVLLWRCLKIRVLRWTVLIDSSLVGWTILIKIIALKTILVVILLSRLMKSWWTHLIRNILTVRNEISDCCDLKLLDVIVEYEKIISSSSLQLSAEDQKSLSEKKKEEHLCLPSHQ
nr:hypothetical protein [Tanacetum cinerariifolium]